jgi:peptidyl-prolyl cis-trans isomerase SurA
MVRQRAREYIQLSSSDRSIKEKEFFREELRRLIERELIIEDLISKVRKNAPQKVAEIQGESQKMAAKQLKSFKIENGMKSETEFLESLKAQGLSLKGIQRQLERGAMMNMYLSQLMRDKVRQASLAEVAIYYQNHLDEFHMEDRVKWLDLFVSYGRFNTVTEAQNYAQDLYEQAKSGADFVKLVLERGHGDSVLRDGEGIGTKPGEIQPRSLEPTLLAMTSGQISELIPTETGIHILKVIERSEAGVRPFDVKTQTAIRARLEQIGRKQEYEKLVDELWRKTTVQITDLP